MTLGMIAMQVVLTGLAVGAIHEFQALLSRRRAMREKQRRDRGD